MSTDDVKHWAASTECNGLRCTECGEDYRFLPARLRDNEWEPCEHCGQRPALDTFRARVADIHKWVEEEATHPWRDMIGQRRQRHTLNILGDALSAVRDVLRELHVHSLGWIDDQVLWNGEQDDPAALAAAEQSKMLIDERVRNAERLLSAFWDAVGDARDWNSLGFMLPPPPAPKPSVTIASEWERPELRRFIWDINRLAEVPKKWRYHLKSTRGIYLLANSLHSPDHVEVGW